MNAQTDYAQCIYTALCSPGGIGATVWVLGIVNGRKKRQLRHAAAVVTRSGCRA